MQGPLYTEEHSGEQPHHGASSNYWADQDAFPEDRSDSGLLPASANMNNQNKRNGGLLKKSSTKFVAAIKSLQCSPRVEGENNYGRLEEKKKPHNQDGVQDQLSQAHSNPQPIFIANFDEVDFSTSNREPELETGSVSKNLDLENVLVRLDSREFEDKSVPVHHENDLEIFTSNTDDTNEDQNDRKSDVIQDLWNLSGLPPQTTEVNSSAFPLSEWDELTTPTREPIQHEYSQDSNDTPVTCNKSLILTPKNNNNQNDPRETSKDDENDNDLYAKPPKELFHRSLSLGDSLTPTEDDSPESCQNNNKINRTDVSGRHGQRPAALNLPNMDSAVPKRRRRSPGSNSVEQNVLRRIQQIETGFSPSLAARPLKQTPPKTPKTTASTPSPPDQDSPISSTVSSFVFSTEGNESKALDSSKANRRRTSSSPSFFWKTHPKTPEEAEPPQSPEPPVSPAFFWKTHPRVTIKSYNFQTRKSIVRKVNTPLEGGRRQIAKVAVS